MSFCPVIGSTTVFLKRSGCGPLVLIPLHLTVEESDRNGYVWGGGGSRGAGAGSGRALADGNARLLFRDSAAQEEREPKS